MINLEAKASAKGAKMKVPPEFMDSYIMDKTGWDIFTLRATPRHEIEKLLTWWHIVSLADEAENRKAKQKNKQKRR